jgi:acyl dehydratase
MAMTSIRDWTLEQLSPGIEAGFEHAITEAEVDAFATLSGDRNPLHCDPAYGRAAGFRDRVAHGVLLGALVSRLIGTELPGRRSLLLSLRLDFVAPTYPGDTITVQGRVDSVHLEQRTVMIRLSITCAGETRLRGSAMVRMSR